MTSRSPSFLFWWWADGLPAFLGVVHWRNGIQKNCPIAWSCQWMMLVAYWTTLTLLPWEWWGRKCTISRLGTIEDPELSWRWWCDLVDLSDRQMIWAVGDETLKALGILVPSLWKVSPSSWPFHLSFDLFSPLSHFSARPSLFSFPWGGLNSLPQGYLVVSRRSLYGCLHRHSS